MLLNMADGGLCMVMFDRGMPGVEALSKYKKLQRKAIKAQSISRISFFVFVEGIVCLGTGCFSFLVSLCV